MNAIPPLVSQSRIILVHGLAAHRSALWLLAWRLRRRGYQTRIFGYPSILRGVRAHAESLQRFLIDYERQADGEPFSIVAHSMGGILLRAMLEHYRPSGLQRIIMLGSPNQGSHAARILSSWLGRICPPLNELSDRSGALVHQLSEPHGIPTAVIAGSRDRVVSVDATRLTIPHEHHVVRSGHGELLFRNDVVELVDHLIRSTPSHEAQAQRHAASTHPAPSDSSLPSPLSESLSK